MRKLWKDRLGEVLTVNGIEFKIVDVEEKGSKIIVEDNQFNDLHETTRSTWRKGSLVNLVREIKKLQMVGKTKKVGDYLFKIIECAKQKFMVTVEGNGLEEIVEVSKDAWKRGTFVGTLRKLGIKVSKNVNRKTKKSKNDIEPKYLPVVIIEKPITSQIVSKYVRQLRTETDYNKFKNQFKILANICHPDKGGNEKVFDMLNKIYKIQGNIIKQAQPILTKKLDVNSVGYKETINAMVKAAFAAKGLSYLY